MRENKSSDILCCNAYKAVIEAEKKKATKDLNVKKLRQKEMMKSSAGIKYRSGSDSIEIPEDILELWKEILDKPDDTEVCIPEDVLLPTGSFFTEAVPMLVFKSIYIYLMSISIEPEVSEEKWLMNFNV